MSAHAERLEPENDEERRVLAVMEQALSTAWPRATEVWSKFLLLRRPVVALEQESIAYIDLGTRHLSINGTMIVERGLVGALEAILAHEVGHHVKYPATLSLQARLRVLESSILGAAGGSYLNLFTDLLINGTLPDHLRPQLTQVYRCFAADAVERADLTFLFYLSIYEKRYTLGAGEIIGPGRELLDATHSGWESDASALAVNLFTLGPNIFTQLTYFLAIFSKYQATQQHTCGIGHPSADDWADALIPSPKEKDAIDRAVAEGWIRRDAAARARGGRDRGARIDALPSDAGVEVPEIMAAHYRRLADRWLLKPPALPGTGEPMLPATTEDWERGDPVSSIDWVATTRQRGHELGAALPLRRERLADDDGLSEQPGPMRVELYLDVSGSMPDPCTAMNVMTLAAEILALGAIRAGGFVRALMYSDRTMSHWTWSRSERELSRFFMRYLGGGTQFPFATLESSVAELRSAQPLRVAITDTDFDGDVRSDRRRLGLLREAASSGPGFILLQHRGLDAHAKTYRELGVRVVLVEDAKDIPGTAAALADALFAGRSRR